MDENPLDGPINEVKPVKHNESPRQFFEKDVNIKNYELTE